MDLVSILKYVVVIDCIVLIVVVVLQNRSGGLGAVFGGGGGEAYRSKRGMEAVLFNVTIVCGIVLGVASLMIAILSV
ncbi:preprotein translocase subunit SecG [Candidatus Dojkabacteria bacterium]|uniref:Protein-export membrane protein SecG n=1 Tax=Candidatus Dojkabacteria bacterium TaxID=2099670 RepID=A0A955KZW3_9BACT|nr:preprotein translocase subunit SecG [Candidatus Dojkabacteria bacterium]